LASAPGRIRLPPNADIHLTTTKRQARLRVRGLVLSRYDFAHGEIVNRLAQMKDDARIRQLPRHTGKRVDWAYAKLAAPDADWGFDEGYV
jgi:hypothetical protein